ncbi:MAG: hypothetical protein ABL865_01770 [Candidatus Nitrotoga sp.]
MNRLALVVALFALSLTACGPKPSATATTETPADASVTISSPAAEAKLKAGSPIPVTYDVIPGSKGGDHTHIYVNGNQKGVLMKPKDTHTLDGLAAGKHDICIKVVNKGHAPIGVEKCVSVSVE